MITYGRIYSMLSSERVAGAAPNLAAERVAESLQRHQHEALVILLTMQAREIKVEDPAARKRRIEELRRGWMCGRCERQCGEGLREAFDAGIGPKLCGECRAAARNMRSNTVAVERTKETTRINAERATKGLNPLVRFEGHLIEREERDRIKNERRDARQEKKRQKAEKVAYRRAQEVKYENLGGGERAVEVRSQIEELDRELEAVTEMRYGYRYVLDTQRHRELWDKKYDLQGLLSDMRQRGYWVDLQRAQREWAEEWAREEYGDKVWTGSEWVEVGSAYREQLLAAAEYEESEAVTHFEEAERHLQRAAKLRRLAESLRDGARANDQDQEAA